MNQNVSHSLFNILNTSRNVIFESDDNVVSDMYDDISTSNIDQDHEPSASHEIMTPTRSLHDESSISQSAGMVLPALEVENTRTNECFLVLREDITEDNVEELIINSAGIKECNVSSYYYFFNNKKISLTKGNRLGFKTFIRFNCPKISIIMRNKNTNKRKRKPAEEEGRKEKTFLKGADVITRADYRRMAKTPAILERLERTRLIMENITCNFNAGCLILNRTTMICPLPECSVEPTVDDGGGLFSMIQHLKSHQDAPLATDIIRNYTKLRQGDDPSQCDICQDGIERLEEKIAITRKDKRLVDIEILKRLVKGDINALDELPLNGVSDYFIPL